VNDYRPGHRATHSLRFRNDTWHDAEDRAGPRKVNQLVELGTEAMCDQVRCQRCDLPVPVELGDCTGMTFSEAVKAAVEAVRRQKCRAHQTVRVSGGGVAVDGDTAAELAGLRAAVEQIQERLAPSVTPSPVPFRPPAVTR